MLLYDVKKRRHKVIYNVVERWTHEEQTGKKQNKMSITSGIWDYE